MMRTLFCIIFVISLFNCTSPARDQRETTDSTTTADSVVATNNTVTEPEKSATFNPSDSIMQTVFLKWKEVSYSDYGPLYMFEDRKGEELRIRLIEIPEWDFEHNDYLDVAYPAGSVYPVITVKELVVGKWYRALLKVETRQLDGVEQELPVLQSLELVDSFD